MFSLPTRILLVVVAASYGTHRLIAGSAVGVALVAGACLLVFGYFRHGAIRPAFSAIQRGDTERAQRLVSSIRFPCLLNPQSRAYLHWINGILDAQDDDRLASAENNMQAALDLGVRTSNDKCALTATMAEVAARRQNVARAKKLLDDARAIPHNQRVGTYIAKLQHELLRPKEAQD